MAHYTVTFDGDGIERMNRALSVLSGRDGKVVYRRALNEVAGSGRALVKRVAAKEMGIKPSALVRRNKLYVDKANDLDLNASVVGRGTYMVLKDFNAKQFKAGVKASPWGRRELFESAFIIKQYSGDVFKRVGKERFPLKKLYGPAMPREMERPATHDKWQELINERLPKRVEQQIFYRTKLEWR